MFGVLFSFFSALKLSGEELKVTVSVRVDVGCYK